MDTDMDISPDYMPINDINQQLLDYNKLNEYKKQIIQNNQRIDELNLQTDAILIPLLYDSLITLYFNTVTIPKIEPYITLYNATKELIDIIQPKYQEYSDSSPETKPLVASKTSLLNDLINLSNRLDYFFKLLVSEKLITTTHSELINYLEQGFRSNPDKYGSIIELINNKQSIDAEVDRLRGEIYNLQQQVIIIDDPEQLTPQQMELQQSMIVSDSTPEKTKHLFLFVCHGNSVSQFKTYFKTRAYFKNIEYMIPFGEPLYAVKGIEDLYNNIHATPSDGTGDINSYLNMNRQDIVDNNVTYKNNEIIISEDEYAYLPPMVFTPITQENPSEGITQELVAQYNSVMGLYHYALNREDGKYYLINIVADYDELVKSMGNSSSLTYSTIARLVRNYFKNVSLSNIQFNEIYAPVRDHIMNNTYEALYESSSIIFFTCRSYFYNTGVINKDVLKFFNSTVVIRQEPTPASIISELSPTDTVSLLSVDIKNFDIYETIKNWQGALAGLYHQGCGLNVLNFYNLLNREAAIGAAACVNIGTSIFKIADYIKDKLPISDIGVCRMPLVEYIKLIQTIISQIVKCLSIYSSFSENSYFHDVVFMFRVYTENKQRGTDAYNEVGHFLSICLKDNHIYFIDPQAYIVDKIKYEDSYIDKNTVSDFLNNIFATTTYSGYKFCDFYIYKNPISLLTYDTLNTQYGGVIRPRPQIIFGGKTNNNRTKRAKRNKADKQARIRKVKTRANQRRSQRKVIKTKQ